MIKLSIIILSWNTKGLLRDCLNSIKNEQDIEIIVVDNASFDGSVEMVKNDFPEVRLIVNKKNLGFAAGNNLGIKAAIGKNVMLLNSDTRVEKGAIKKLLNVAEEGKANMAVSPQLLLPNGKKQNDYYMRFPNLWQIFFYHNPILRPLAINLPFLNRLVIQKPGRNHFLVDQLPGAALLAGKEVWQKVGLLDENYRFLFEDVDWCWRAKKTGIKLMVVPESRIVHLGGASWKNKLKKDKRGFYYQYFVSMLLFVKKNYSESKTALFRRSIIINFILTLKPMLAHQFYKFKGEQKNFLE